VDDLEPALLDPQLRSHLGIVATNLLDAPLRVFAPDERLDGITKREVGRGEVVDDGVDDHERA
jgi:hypothetical protein